MQPDLFTPQANYKKGGPETSRAAAVLTETQGWAATHRALLLRAVQVNPGRTSGELARLCSLDRHAAARRLPELREKHLVRNGEPRVCSECRTKQMTWWAVEGEGRQHATGV